jgi:hypothetical protein
MYLIIHMKLNKKKTTREYIKQYASNLDKDNVKIQETRLINSAKN